MAAFLYKSQVVKLAQIKDLLDSFLGTSLSYIEKLSILEIYLIKNDLYNFYKDANMNVKRGEITRQGKNLKITFDKEDDDEEEEEEDDES